MTLILTIFYLTVYAQMVIISIFIQYKELLMKYLIIIIIFCLLQHHRRHGCEFEQTLGVGDGQRSLVCCNPWGCKESDTTERLN